jgi:hypothetical protein
MCFNLFAPSIIFLDAFSLLSINNMATPMPFLLRMVSHDPHISNTRMVLMIEARTPLEPEYMKKAVARRINLSTSTA